MNTGQNYLYVGVERGPLRNGSNIMVYNKSKVEYLLISKIASVHVFYINILPCKILTSIQVLQNYISCSLGNYLLI